MTATTYSTADHEIERAVEDTARRLVAVSRESEGYVIGTPSLYPSGASVQIKVAFDGHTCFVSDMGLAWHEAEMLGATHRQFKRHSKAVAEELGVGFDDHSFFVLQVPIDRLSGAVKVVAAATHRAAVMTEVNLSEQAARNDKDLLLDRLVSVFGVTSVDSEYEVVGKSGHSWVVVGRVHLGKEVLFDTATPWHNSVVSTFTKFHDIKLLADAPAGVVAVSTPTKFGVDYLSLLRQSAEVISIDDSDARYRELSLAA